MITNETRRNLSGSRRTRINWRGHAQEYVVRFWLNGERVNGLEWTTDYLAAVDVAERFIRGNHCGYSLLLGCFVPVSPGPAMT